MISPSTGSRGRSATFALYTAATKMILCCRAANNMTRAARRGTARKRIGVTLIVVGGIGMMLQQVFNFIPHSDTVTGRMLWVLPFFYFLSLPMFLWGAFLFWRGRQYAAKADAERIVTDSNLDVLYLRAFRSDPSTAKYVFRSLLAVWGAGWTTEEEQLADVLRPFGDLVAIGRPGEALPEPGAARIYASNEEWKDVVEGQMRAARLVVIRAGVGENLLWELKQSVKTLSPQKLLILVLNMKAKCYESFRTTVNPELSMSLPEGATLRREFTRLQFVLHQFGLDQEVTSFGRVSGFIGFAADWKPSFFPLRAPYLRRSFFKPYRPFFKFALRPVFESFGLEWQPPPVSVATILTKALLALFGLLAIIVAVRFELAEATLLAKAVLALFGLSILIAAVRLAVKR
jgi:hypothetical protein